MVQCIAAVDGHMIINGVPVEYPTKRKSHNITQINGQVFVDGYEYKNGKWERTIKAFLHLII